MSCQFLQNGYYCRRAKIVCSHIRDSEAQKTCEYLPPKPQKVKFVDETAADAEWQNFCQKRRIPLPPTH